MELIVEQLWGHAWFVYRKFDNGRYAYVWKDGTYHDYTKEDFMCPIEDACEDIGAFHKSLDEAYKWANKMGFKLKIYYPE